MGREEAVNQRKSDGGTAKSVNAKWTVLKLPRPIRSNVGGVNVTCDEF